MSVAVVDAGDVSDGEVVRGWGTDLDAVATGEGTFFDDPHVASGAIGRRECCGKVRIVHADTQFVTGHPGFTYLEHCVVNSQTLAYDRVREVDCLGGEIVAERTRMKSPTKSPTPPFVVLRGVRVHRLVYPAVNASIGLVVTDEVDTFDPNGALDRRLVYPRRYGVTPELDHLGRADVDRDDFAHGVGSVRMERRMAEQLTNSAKRSMSIRVIAPKASTRGV